jgi:hypothetical protein
VPDDIGTFEPSDLAYEAFVSDCLSMGIDPDSGDPIGFAFGFEWSQEALDPFYGEALEGEPVEF